MLKSNSFSESSGRKRYKFLFMSGLMLMKEQLYLKSVEEKMYFQTKGHAPSINGNGIKTLAFTKLVICAGIFSGNEQLIVCLQFIRKYKYYLNRTQKLSLIMRTFTVQHQNKHCFPQLQWEWLIFLSLLQFHPISWVSDKYFGSLSDLDLLPHHCCLLVFEWIQQNNNNNFVFTQLQNISGWSFSMKFQRWNLRKHTIKFSYVRP